MSPLEIALACAVAVVAAAVGAVAGGNSLLTVPALIALGVPGKSAVATNMVGVAALSLAAGLRFLSRRHVPKHPTLGLMALAVPGSVVGAFITVSVSEDVLRIIIAVAMLSLSLFLALRRQFGTEVRDRGAKWRFVTYIFSAVWAVYGGMFSGGYTTVLTVVCVAGFGVSLRQSVALTKWVNSASSVAAVVLFLNAGAVDIRLAIPFSAAMAVGGVLGAFLSERASPRVIRWVVLGVAATSGTALLVATLT